ncbi:MAG: Protein-arginine kinase [Oscillospiraceae bacterium]|jgi:protein arginine kinase
MSKWYEAASKDADVSAGTYISLARNLTGVPFPSRMSVSDRRFVMKKVLAALEGDSGYERCTKINLESVTKIHAASLAERGLISAEMVTERNGRGLIVSEDESLSIAVNGEDHLTIQSIAAGLQLENAYSAADRLDTFLDRTLPFAFDSQLGYLTQNPFHLGTGMVASIRLHLPALVESGSTSRIAHNLSKLGLTLHSIYGSESNPRGAFFRLSNQVTMGLSEREALENLSSMAKQIVTRERNMREELIHQLFVQDSILRNLGILQNARLLSFDEFLERASAVRFGVAAGMIRGINICDMDTMIYKAQPATLAYEQGESLTKEEHRKLRASMVRQKLKEGMEAL